MSFVPLDSACATCTFCVGFWKALIRPKGSWGCHVTHLSGISRQSFDSDFTFLYLFFLLGLLHCLICLVPFLLMAAMLWIFLLRILQYFLLRNRLFVFVWLLSSSLEMIVWSAVYMCCHMVLIFNCYAFCYQIIIYIILLFF